MTKSKVPFRSEELTARLVTARSTLANAKRWKKTPPAQIRILERDLAVAKLLAAVEDSLKFVIPPTPEQMEEIYSLLDAYAGVDPATRDERRCQQKSAA